MKLFKYINQAGGVFAAVFFLIMVGFVRRGIDGRSYYFVGSLFLIFSAMFIVTACVLMFRSLMWHIRNNKLISMVRHYVYAYIGFYFLLMLIDHITMGSISWAHNLLYALIGALLELYIHGYLLEFNPKVVETDEETEEAQEA